MSNEGRIFRRDLVEDFGTTRSELRKVWRDKTGALG